MHCCFNLELDQHKIGLVVRWRTKGGFGFRMKTFVDGTQIMAMFLEHRRDYFSISL